MGEEAKQRKVEGFASNSGGLPNLRLPICSEEITMAMCLPCELTHRSSFSGVGGMLPNCVYSTVFTTFSA